MKKKELKKKLAETEAELRNLVLKPESTDAIITVHRIKFQAKMNDIVWMGSPFNT